MKNGDTRSAKWVKRNLPAYLRDNIKRTPEDMQLILGLVIHDQPVPLDVIASWTPEQRLLADDWAINVHYSASDNNNRVPAKPAFLEGYR